MAFGAGAPDVFASISASENGDIEGIVMGISVLLGSSLFILSVVTSLVILSSP
jgi:Ca2+/Na+ antiporter